MQLLLREQWRVRLFMIFRTHNPTLAGPRRQLHHASFSQCLFGKGVVAFIGNVLQQRMFRWCVCSTTSPCLPRPATGDLECKAGRNVQPSENRRKQRAESTSSNATSVTPGSGDLFAQHLRANQDPRAAAMHFHQLLFQRPLRLVVCAVDTRNGDTREQRWRERLFVFRCPAPGTRCVEPQERSTGAARGR